MPWTVLHATPQELFRGNTLTACLGPALPKITAQTSAAANGYIQYGILESNQSRHVISLVLQPELYGRASC